jgi:hypothetical protein
MYGPPQLTSTPNSWHADVLVDRNYEYLNYYLGIEYGPSDLELLILTKNGRN